MKTFLTSLLSCATSCAIAAPSFAATPSCSKQSPAHTVALLELYTSEGCSSCPPADQAFGRLRAEAASTGRLGIDQVVPLALHVDYWDYIGWKDLFASSVHTERQHWLSGLAKSRTVYTPEMFAGGQELRNWSSGIPAAVRRINGQPAKADIGITLGTPVPAGLPVEVSIQARQAGNLFVALYENALASQVGAGENGGTTLHHDYVVRQWIGPVDLRAAGGVGKMRWMQTLRLPTGAKAANLGVAAFVQSGSGEVLQALALPLCSA